MKAGWPAAPNRLSGTIDGLERGAVARVWIEAIDAPAGEGVEAAGPVWELGNGPWRQQVADLPPGRYLVRAEAEGYVFTSCRDAFEVFESGITWHYNLMHWTFLRCDERARLTQPYCTEPPDSTIELPLSGLRGEVTGLAAGQVATVTVRFWPPDDGEPFPPVPADPAGGRAAAVAALDSLPPGAEEWVTVAEVPARDGRWGRIDFEMAGARYLVTARAAGQAATPAAYSVTLFDTPLHSVADGVDWRFAPAGAAGPAVPHSTATATDSSLDAARPFRVEALPFEMTLPAGWGAATGPAALGEGFKGLVAFNNWGAAEEWLPAWPGGGPPDDGPYTRVWKLPPGGAYVVLLLQDESPWGPAYPSPEQQERDLTGVWWEEDCRGRGLGFYKAGVSSYSSFNRWGRQLQLEVHCRADASDETAAAVNAFLSSWRFDEVVPRDAGWAVAAARRLLPHGVGGDGFPNVSWAVTGRDVLSNTLSWSSTDARSTRVEWQGDSVLVTFEYRWNNGLEPEDHGQPYDFRHWWRYDARPDGRVALSAEGGDPIPAVTAPLPVAHYVDPELGFAADYPAWWQVFDVAGHPEPPARRFLVRAFGSGLHAGGNPMAPHYTIEVWMGEAAGATVTETVEAGMAGLDEGQRAQFQRRCCRLLGGEPAMELKYPPFMSQGILEWVALHGGREYRVRLWPMWSLDADDLGAVQAHAAIQGLLDTFTFIPVVPPPTPTLTPTPTPVPTRTPGPPPVAPPAGLVYIASGALWQVDGDGVSQLLFQFDVGEAVLSPDGAQVAYTAWEGWEGDVCVADLATGERRNLTGEQDRVERTLQWWAGRPHAIVLGSAAPDDLTREDVQLGFLTLVNDDGSGYRVLDASAPCMSWPALSPDGQTIAYVVPGEARLYREGVGVERLDPAAYGLTGDYDLTFGSPSWSPDGRWLAWVTARGAPGETQAAVVVFDLIAGTAHVLQPHDTLLAGGLPPAAPWSPDGEWLAIYARPRDVPEIDTWLLRPDGSEERRIPGFVATWSPDGRQLVVQRIEQIGGSKLWLVDVSSGDALELALPLYAQVVAWRAAGD